MGMDDELISMAYERTCLNTGGLNWAYMNKFLQRWQQQGFHSAEDVPPRRPGHAPPEGPRPAGEAELEAIQSIAGGMNSWDTVRKWSSAPGRVWPRRRKTGESENRQHLAEAYAKVPRIREIDMLLRRTMAQAAQAAFFAGF